MAGSFSAVSKRNFASKDAFDSIFQALQDLHTFAPLQTQQFRKNRYEELSYNFSKTLQTLQNLNNDIMFDFFLEFEISAKESGRSQNMLKNAYILSNIDADIAENDQHTAEF